MVVNPNDPIVTGLFTLFGTAFGAFVHHLGTQEKNKLGTAKTPLASGGLAVAQAVLPGQVEKADKWLIIHAGPIAGTLLGDLLGVTAQAIESAPGANPVIAGALGGQPPAATPAATTTTTTQTVATSPSQAAAPAPDPASLDPLPGAGVHPLIETETMPTGDVRETITMPDGTQWTKVNPK